MENWKAPARNPVQARLLLILIRERKGDCVIRSRPRCLGNILRSIRRLFQPCLREDLVDFGFTRQFLSYGQRCLVSVLFQLRHLSSLHG